MQWLYCNRWHGTKICHTHVYWLFGTVLNLLQLEISYLAQTWCTLSYSHNIDIKNSISLMSLDRRLASLRPSLTSLTQSSYSINSSTNITLGTSRQLLSRADFPSPCAVLTQMIWQVGQRWCLRCWEMREEASRNCPMHPTSGLKHPRSNGSLKVQHNFICIAEHHGSLY